VGECEGPPPLSDIGYQSKRFALFTLPSAEVASCKGRRAVGWQEDLMIASVLAYSRTNAIRAKPCTMTLTRTVMKAIS
jgi:hypothetical protein